MADCAHHKTGGKKSAVVVAVRHLGNPELMKIAAHSVRLAASLAAAKAGKRIAIKAAMIPITTSNSTSVKPVRADRYR